MIRGAADLARRAEAHAADLAPWPRYYRFRAREIGLALRGRGAAPAPSLAVEIGCGIGFAAGLLSSFARKVIAIDLPVRDRARHALGMEPARRLRERLDLSHALVAADAASLPLPEGAADLVLSAYVLEHVAERDLACREIARILSDEGEALLLLPGAAERVWAPLWYYLHLAKEIATSLRAYLLRARGRVPPRASNQGPPPPRAARTPNAHAVHLWSRFREHYPHFPAVPPHGVYRGSWHELRSCRAASWRRLLADAGLEVVEHRASMLIPVALLDDIDPALRDAAAALQTRLVRRWGGGRLLRAISYGSLWRVRRVRPCSSKGRASESIAAEPPVALQAASP